MGLWSATCKVANFTGKAIKFVFDEINKIDNESKQYLEEYRNLDKYQLINKYKSNLSSKAQKLAAFKVMKEKGYYNKN